MAAGQGGALYSPGSGGSGGARSSGGNSLGLYLGAFFLAAMGLIFLNDFRYALAAQTRWTSASGRVTENRVEVRHSRRSTSYSSYVSYTYNTEAGYYSAGPVEVYKHKLYFTENGAWEDLQDNFAEGRSLTVYYNPDNPGQSSLGLAGAPGPQVAIVFFLLAFGAFYAAKNQ